MLDEANRNGARLPMTALVDQFYAQVDRPWRPTVGHQQPDPPARGGLMDPLANVVWEALTTDHAAFAEGDGGARRYQPDVAVFAGMADDAPSSWASLAELIGPERTAVLFRASPVEAPEGWAVVFAGQGHQMVSTAPLAPLTVDVVELGDADAPEMRALVRLAQPGPFAERTHELGGYVGIRDPPTAVCWRWPGGAPACPASPR